MALVKDIMTADVLTVTPGTTITQAARLMLERRFNALPVVDDGGALVGIISQSDLISLQKDLPLPSYFTLLDGLIPLASPKPLREGAGARHRRPGWPGHDASAGDRGADGHGGRGRRLDGG